MTGTWIRQTFLSEIAIIEQNSRGKDFYDEFGIDRHIVVAGLVSNLHIIYGESCRRLFAFSLDINIPNYYNVLTSQRQILLDISVLKLLQKCLEHHNPTCQSVKYSELTITFSSI
jgi:hypothetical protein